MQETKGTAQLAAELAEPFCTELGLILWDTEYKKEGSDYVLRIFIDKEGGVGIDDCEALSRAIDQPLDAADFVKESYCLEVSSPGAERLLRLPWHYEQYIGQLVDVKLFRKIEGAKLLTGTLEAYEGGTITLRPDGGEALTIPEKDRVSVRTHFEF